MPTHSNMNQSKQQANLPPEQRPRGSEPGMSGNSGAGDRGQAQQGPGEPSPGLKDKDAETSNSYGDTRESGEQPK